MRAGGVGNEGVEVRKGEKEGSGVQYGRMPTECFFFRLPLSLSPYPPLPLSSSSPSLGL